MKVAFDITVLGQGAVDNAARTGVYRVIDQIARYVAQHDDVDAHWSCCAGRPYDQACRQLLDSAQLPRRPLITPTPARGFGAAAYQTLESAGRIRYLNRLLLPLRRVADGAMEARFKRAMSSMNVLHSTYLPLPDWSRWVPHLARVFTAYDLIPIKFPHLFVGGDDHPIRLAVDALEPSDWVVCISASTRRDLLEYRPDLRPNQVRVTPLAASHAFYHCHDIDRIRTLRRKVGLPETAPYFLSLCTLEPRKNLRHVLGSFQSLLEQTDGDPYLLLVGTRGWRTEDLMDDLSNMAKSRVIATGYLPDEDLAPLYSGATAFVYMSLYEGFGLPPLEAMQCGTPVITSDNSSLPEVVGDAGVMLPAGDRDALVVEMLRMLHDAEHRNALAAAGIERAKTFSWDRCGEATVATYRDAVAAHS